MVDNVNPTNQFHPYQPPTDTPVAERQPTGLDGILAKAGLKNMNLNNLDLNGSINKMRDYARAKPGMVLGGLAAAAIGLGMLRGRAR